MSCVNLELNDMDIVFDRLSRYGDVTAIRLYLALTWDSGSHVRICQKNIN